jgi:hypothetical protein
MNRTQTILLFIIAFSITFQTSLQSYIFFSNHKIVNEGISKPESVPAIKSIPDLPKTALKFDKQQHNFGIIKDDKKQYTAFEFTNTGKEPLMILSAEGSCGCTVPSWPREPIAPGKSAKIEIAFDPNGKTGEHSKIVTVTSNTNPSTTILTIQANIIKSN